MKDETANFSLKFDGPLTIRTIDAVHQKIVSAMAGKGRLEIDFSQATAVDLSFIQLVIAIQASSLESGRGIAFVSPMPAMFRNAADRAGLDVEALTT